MTKPVVMRRPLSALYKVYSGFDSSSGHNGIVFDSTAGGLALACANGRVIKTGRAEDGRNYVWLWCELPEVTCRVVYSGLGKVMVQEGQSVRVDDHIGITRNVPGLKNARLYFEVRVFPGDVAVEPDFYDDYIDPSVIRALPPEA